MRSVTWLTNTALMRSGARSLTVDLTMISHATIGWKEYANLCLDPILNHSHRWKSVNFQLSSHALRKLSIVKDALPALETLKIQIPVAFDAVLDAFEVAPPLRYLCTNASPDVLKIPGEQLKRFDGIGVCQRHCLNWFHRYSNLIRSRIMIQGNIDTNIPSSLMVRLPQLITLEIIEGEGLAVLEVLFNSLATPVLSNLSIINSVGTAVIRLLLISQT